jgi:GGDEF domain-containing protein
VGPERGSVDAITARFQQNLKNHNAKRKHKYELSVSFGVTYFDPENPCSIDELLARGDTIMYEQKRLKQKGLRILN